jgi:hypothetical protein
MAKHETNRTSASHQPSPPGLAEKAKTWLGLKTWGNYQFDSIVVEVNIGANWVASSLNVPSGGDVQIDSTSRREAILTPGPKVLVKNTNTATMRANLLAQIAELIQILANVFGVKVEAHLNWSTDNFNIIYKFLLNKL